MPTLQRYSDTVSMNHKSCVRCIAMPPRYVHNFVSPPCDTKLVHDAVPQCHRKVVLKATQELSTIVVSRGSLSVVSLSLVLRSGPAYLSYHLPHTHQSHDIMKLNKQHLHSYNSPFEVCISLLRKRMTNMFFVEQN